jgi:hypothetical protein
MAIISARQCDLRMARKAMLAKTNKSRRLRKSTDKL